MNELEASAQIQILAAQRNALADQVVEMAGKATVTMQQMQKANTTLQRRIEELEVELKAAKPQQAQEN